MGRAGAQLVDVHERGGVFAGCATASATSSVTLLRVGRLLLRVLARAALTLLLIHQAASCLFEAII